MHAPRALGHRLEGSQRGALGTRGRAGAQPVLSAGAPAVARGGPGEGRGGEGRSGWGWGGDRDFALCLSPSLSAEPPAETRPHPSAGWAAGAGPAPPPGFFSKSRPDLPVVRAVTEVVPWGRGLPARDPACKHLRGDGEGAGRREEAREEKMALEAALLLLLLGDSAGTRLGRPSRQGSRGSGGEGRNRDTPLRGSPSHGEAKARQQSCNCKVILVPTMK